MSSEPQEFQYDFTLDWMINRTANDMSVFERTPNGVGVGKSIASFGPEHDAAIRRLVDGHNQTVQMLLANIDELKNGPRPGWAFIDDDGSEWSDSHPVESGEHEYAEHIRPCTLLEFWSAES